MTLIAVIMIAAKVIHTKKGSHKPMTLDMAHAMSLSKCNQQENITND